MGYKVIYNLSQIYKNLEFLVGFAQELLPKGIPKPCPVKGVRYHLKNTIHFRNTQL